MKKIATWILILSPIFLAYQCVEKDKCYTEYHLQFETKITPERDTISLNDTLWFEMRIADSLFDIYSQQWIPSNRVTFPFYFTMTKLEETGYLPAEEMFEFVPILGTLNFERLSQFTDLIVNMEKKENGNISTFAFIPKQKGIFKATPNMLRIDFEDLQVGNDGCRPFVKDISFQTNGNTSVNGYYLIRASGSPLYQNYSEADHKKDGGFAFVVVD